MVVDKNNATIFSTEVNHEGFGGCIDTTFKYLPIVDGYIESYENRVVFKNQEREKEYFIKNEWAVYYGDENYHFVWVTGKEDLVGFINVKTDYIQEPIFSDTDVVSEDEIFVCLEGKWGLMNSSGRYLLNPKCVNRLDEFPSAIFKSLQNLLHYDLEFLDLYDGYSLDGKYLNAFTQNRSDLYIIKEDKIEILQHIQ